MQAFIKAIQTLPKLNFAALCALEKFRPGFILATSTRLHPSLHFANYPINPVNRSLLCTFIAGIIYIPVVI